MQAISLGANFLGIYKFSCEDFLVPNSENIHLNKLRLSGGVNA